MIQFDIIKKIQKKIKIDQKKKKKKKKKQKKKKKKKHAAEI